MASEPPALTARVAGAAPDQFEAAALRSCLRGRLYHAALCCCPALLRRWIRRYIQVAVSSQSRTVRLPITFKHDMAKVGAAGCWGPFFFPNCVLVC